MQRVEIMKSVGLVLEGGGMRGAYTAGILDVFMEHGIRFDYVIGVSSGANNGSNFITNQKGRSKELFLKWSQDKRFIGWSNLIRYGSYFGMEFIFNHLPNDLLRFEYATFSDSETQFCTCVSNCDTGYADYFNKDEVSPVIYMNKVIRASCSLPVMSPSVKVGEYRYVDGFITDPIPINKSIEEGNEFNVVVLTKIQTKIEKLSLYDRLLARLTKLMYPNLVPAINQSLDVYNKSLQRIFDLENEGKVYVFRPNKDHLNNRYTKDRRQVEKVYNMGVEDAQSNIMRLKKWMAD